MLRLGNDNRIFGLAIENYRLFAQKHQDFHLVFLPVTNPFQYKALSFFLTVMNSLKVKNEETQRNEMAEYLSGLGVYGGIA